jgi:hypothetical protein
VHHDRDEVERSTMNDKDLKEEGYYQIRHANIGIEEANA